MDKKIVRSIIQEEIKRKGSLKIKVFGGSMSPVIKANQKVEIINSKEVKVGDIICYKAGVWFLIHRVKSIDENRGIITVEGDSRDRVLHKIKKSAIIGKVKENIYNKILRVPAVIMKKILKKKEKYEKPALKSQKIFETSTLACGKCNSGPIKLPSCKGSQGKKS
ncbi:MAG: S24/S26 family peptidase [Candidatus Firestonebacteria bacterium]